MVNLANRSKRGKLPEAALEFHPLANLFPLMEGEAFENLKTDVKANGLIEPIVLLDDRILDGRNRYLAALAVGVEPTFSPFRGDDPLTYVISRNLHRRHLDESQRAMIAAKIANMRQGARTDLSPIGETSQATAAKLLNVGKRSVERAAIVRAAAVPEVQEAVEQGRLAVSTAADLATVPVEQQRDIVAASKLTPEALAPAIKEIRAAKVAAKKRRSSAECRSADFENAVHFLTNICEHAVDIDIHHATTAQIDDAIEALAEAKADISKLQQRLRQQTLKASSVKRVPLS